MIGQFRSVGKVRPFCSVRWLCYVVKTSFVDLLHSIDKQHFRLTLMMTSAQVVETSVTVTDKSPFQDYPHPDDHTTRSTVTPGFKPFTELYHSRFTLLSLYLIILSLLRCCMLHLLLLQLHHKPVHHAKQLR